MSLEANEDIMCVPGTPKLTSVDSLCRHNESLEAKNEDVETEDGFLNRVVFDRNEILRKHYQIEKTDTELIKETLDHFSKKMVKQEKVSAHELDRAIGFKSKLKFASKHVKSIEHYERTENFAEPKDTRNELSVTQLLKSVGKKKKNMLKIKIEPKAQATSTATQNPLKALMSFKDLSLDTSNHKRFRLEDREPDSQNSNTKRSNVQPRPNLDKMEFSIDNQLLKGFDAHKFSPEQTSFGEDDCFKQPKINNDTFENRDKNYFSMSFDELEYKDKPNSSEVMDRNTISISNYNTVNDKASPVVPSNGHTKKTNTINLNMIKFNEIKPSEMKIDGNAKRLVSFERRARKISDISSCESIHKTSHNNCHCDKFKLMAKQLGMPFDAKFVDRVQAALFKCDEPKNVEEGAQKRVPNYKLKLLNKKVLDNIDNIQKEKKSFMVLNKENTAANDEQRASAGVETNIKARIDKLKAFKKYFMKTENDEHEAKQARRKKSNDLNTFR